MAKVKIIQSCAGLDFSYYPGEVVEMEEKKAASFVKDGLAQLESPSNEGDSKKPVATTSKKGKK